MAVGVSGFYGAMSPWVNNDCRAGKCLYPEFDAARAAAVYGGSLIPS